MDTILCAEVKTDTSLPAASREGLVTPPDFIDGLPSDMWESILNINEQHSHIESARGSEGIGQQQDKVRPQHTFVLGGKRSPLNRFISLQKWEGVVLEIDEECFSARLSNFKKQDDEEICEIYLSEISDEDKNLVTPGAVFYWSIGYHTDMGGQRKRSSIIRFRRLGIWTTHDEKQANDFADETIKLTGWV